MSGILYATPLNDCEFVDPQANEIINILTLLGHKVHVTKNDVGFYEQLETSLDCFNALLL